MGQSLPYLSLSLSLTHTRFHNYVIAYFSLFPSTLYLSLFLSTLFLSILSLLSFSLSISLSLSLYSLSPFFSPLSLSSSLSFTRSVCLSLHTNIITRYDAHYTEIRAQPARPRGPRIERFAAGPRGLGGRGARRAPPFVGPPSLGEKSPKSEG